MLQSAVHPLEMKVFRQNGDLYLNLRGGLVRGTHKEVERIIDQQFSGQLDRLMLNLRDVSFLDSAGVGMLVAQKVRCSRERIQFLVLEPSELIGHIFAFAHLDRIFSVVCSSEAQHLRQQFERSEINLQAHFSPVLPDLLQELQDLDLLGSKSSPTVDELCQKAMEQARLGRLDDGVNLYRKALQIEPRWLPALNNIALLYEQRAQWRSQSILAWQKVIEVAQEDNDEKHVLRAQRRLAMLHPSRLSQFETEQETVLD